MRLADRLRHALDRPLDPAMPLLPGDFAADDAPVRASAAAVLIAVTDRAEPGVILTQRTDTLANHAGQVALPGGRVDAGDADAVAAALREAEEEIALPRSAVEVVGVADGYRTVTGFAVTPVLGVVPPDLMLVPEPGEVQAIFEVPLAHLLDERNFTHQRIEWQGRMRDYREMHWERHRIWGATAAMLINLSRRLRWAT
ncbi:CoA pyrophosphatase [Sphingomonas baiyangensis]|uniref:CoA pyrophosphatase n=1 Tax=Sphingomonas baiyangensis TaxID=2572576 RepID=A0A4U1L8C5_9SPHN|nr:CoA pyrophosphatase [Sphingomonas baiyangensis]TKD53221.1 CoA pyrophosphatase [Sphingomonas baiyangensis]